MLKYIEPVLHILYLMPILIMGGYLIRNSVGNGVYKAFGSFALTLALADGIYLLPRMYALLTTGIEENLNIIGWGRMGHAILVTILFLMFYDIYTSRYSKNKNPKFNKTLFTLGIIRIIISILPGNGYFVLDPSPFFALLRFIPLAIMGFLLITAIYYHSKKYKDRNFKIIMVAAVIALVFTEPRMYGIEGAAVLVQTVFRSISLVAIVAIGYKELKDINILSRY